MTTFIISEFNPFHKGHEYLISKAAQLYPGDGIVCIMSGNTVQRGTVAIMDKYARARAAVQSGANLVLLLPAPFSFQSANYFAYGACEIIKSLNLEGRVFFASECGSMEELDKAAEILESAEFSRLLEARPKSEPYAVARQRIYSEMGYKGDLLEKPNNILAIEYINALKGTKGVTLRTVKRNADFLSSSAIRGMRDNEAEVLSSVPDATARAIEECKKEGIYPADIRFAERYVLGLLHLADQFPAMDGEGGLAARITAAAKDAAGYDELLAKVQTKAYTAARINRVILNICLGVTRQELDTPPLYTCLLAAGGKGCEILKNIKRTSDIPVLTKPSDTESLSQDALMQYEIEKRADRLFCLSTPKILPSNEFIKRTPYIEKRSDI